MTSLPFRSLFALRIPAALALKAENPYVASIQRIPLLHHLPMLNLLCISRLYPPSILARPLLKTTKTTLCGNSPFAASSVHALHTAAEYDLTVPGQFPISLFSQRPRYPFAASFHFPSSFILSRASSSLYRTTSRRCTDSPCP